MARFRHDGKGIFDSGMIRRGLTLLLSMSMTLSLFINTALLPVSAAEIYAGGPCEHHTEHTEDCGYSEGAPCAFMCEICSAQTDGADAEPDPEPAPEEQPQTGGNAGSGSWLTEVPQDGAQPWDIVFPADAGKRFTDDEMAWIEAELRKVERQYNSGIATVGFLETGVIPWKYFTAVTNVNRPEINSAFETQWKQALDTHIYKDGYPVKQDGINASKFPTFNRMEFARVTVDGIPANILGVLTVTNKADVYYYLAAQYVQSQDSTRVSAVILGEDQKFTVTYNYLEYKVDYEVVVEDLDSKESAYGLNNKPEDDPNAASNYVRENDPWPSYYDENTGEYVPYTYEQVEQFLMGDTKNTSSVALACSFDVYLTNLYDYQVQVLCYLADEKGEFHFTEEPNADNNSKFVVDLTAKRSGEKADHTVNRGNPIGMEPMYDENGEVNGNTPGVNNGKYGMLEKVDGVTKPTTRLFATTFYENDMTTDLYVKLVLTRLYNGTTKVPVFDARPFMNTDNSGQGTRGSTAKVASGADQRSQMDGNIDTADNWGWQSNNNEIGGTIKQKTIPMTWDKETNSYSYTWTFQTNDGDSFQLDRMILNNVEINIPVKPLDAWWQQDVDKGVGLGNYDKTTNIGIDKKGTSPYHPDEPTLLEEGVNCTTLTLSDGTTIKLIYVRYFDTGKKSQRVYQLQITNAHSKVHITMANLFQSAGGAPEIAVSGIRGVYTNNPDSPIIGFRLKYRDISETPNKTFITWEDEKLVEDPIYVFHNDDKIKRYDQSFVTDGDEDHYGANIHFKLMPGYDSPEYGTRLADVGAAEHQSTYVWEYDAEKKTYIQTNQMKENPVIPLDADKEDNSILLHGKHPTPDKDAPGGFKEKEGYLTDGKLDVGYIYGPDADGWYYVRLDWTHQDVNAPNYNKMVMVRVQAMKQEYMVHYRPGEVTRDYVDMTTMPYYEHESSPHSTENWWGDPTKEDGKYLDFYNADQFLYNDNSGLFYDLSRNTSMSTVEKKPEVDLDKPGNPFVEDFNGTKSATKVFSTWALGDENSNPIYTYEDAEGKLHPAYVCKVGDDGILQGYTKAVSSGYSSVPPAPTTTDTNAVMATPEDITEDGGKLVMDPNTRQPKLWATVAPAKALLLTEETPNGDPVYKFGLKRDLGDFVEPGEEAMINGASNVELFVIRLVAVWDPAPTKFNYNIWMVAQRPDGSYSVPEMLQKVTTENLVYDNDESSKWLEVMVDIENGRFVDWMADNPFYTFDTDTNTTETPKGGVEKRPGTNESANYYIRGEYRYYVTDGGDVYIYLKESNGKLEIKNIVVGVAEDSDETFTYRITATAKDGASALPEENTLYYYWLEDGTHRTGSNAKPFYFTKQPDGSLVTEITLKANQTIEAYVPGCHYNIAEASGAFSYDLEIGGNVNALDKVMEKGKLIDDGKKAELGRTVIVGQSTDMAIFRYSVQSLTLTGTPTVKKTVNVLRGELPEKSYTFHFTVSRPAGYDDSVIKMVKENEAIDVTVDTSGGGKTFTNTGNFSGVTFFKEGTYNFSVKERTSDLPEGFTAESDSLIWTAKVTNNRGLLTLEHSAEVEFVNNFVKLDPNKAHVQPEVNVELIGSYLKGNDFSFAMTPPKNDSHVSPGGTQAVNNDAGMIRFPYVEFDEAGEYGFVIKQNTENNPYDVDLDKGAITITYAVEKDADGKLNLTKTTYSKDNAATRGDNDTFVNIASATQDITVSKRFLDDDKKSELNWDLAIWKEGDITFTAEVAWAENKNVELTSGGKTIKFDTNNRTGKFSFKFSAGGDYRFLVTEAIPSLENMLEGVTYDSHEYEVVIRVTDNGSGDLKTDVKVDGMSAKKVTITNLYSVKYITFPIMATKKLNGGVPDTEFQFMWQNVEDPTNQGRTTNNTVNGTINFNIPFVEDQLEEGKTFRYKLWEIGGGDPSIKYIYDTREFFVEVKVVRVNNDNNQPLKISSITYKDADGKEITQNDLVFKNVTLAPDTVEIRAKKTLTGASLSAGQFKFKLEGSTGSYEATNDAAGNIVFSGISFASAGRYEYELREVNDSAPNITYDDTVYKVIVDVNSVDGKLQSTVTYQDSSGKTIGTPTFKNTYKGDGGPGPGWTPGPDKPVLNTEDHYAYLIGYEDGTVRPGANITRAEAVTIFFRLLTDEMRDKYWTTTNPYPDVERPAWYNNAISTMTNLGIVDGYEDGTFRPGANITRAELTKIAVGFFRYADLQLTGRTRFSDVPQGLWYARFIEAATELGLIEGYPDNTFRPEQPITRAETVTIVNRALGRKPHKGGLLADMITWPDNMNEDAWYYADIQEATNSHDYRMGLYSSDGTWYYADDLHSEDFQMGWSVSSGAWNWPEDMRGQDFLLCRHKSDGAWYYADIQDADRSHDFVICQHNSNGAWTWRYADDSPDNAVSGEFGMAPYDGTWTYPDDTDTDAHDFLVCWHKSDGTWTWYYADDLREDQATHDLQMVLYGTGGMYEHWTALLPVRDWAAFEQTWSELHPDVPNPGEVMDRALSSSGIASEKSGEEREKEPED